MRFRLLPVAAVVAVLVSACGGSSTPTTAKTTSSHKAGTSHKPSGSQTQASASTGTGSVTRPISTSTAPVFADAAHCTELDGVSAQFDKAMAAATKGGKFNLDAEVKDYQNLANAAPSEIRPDVQALASALTAYAAALSKAGYTAGSVPSATQIAAILAAAKALDTAKVATAIKNLEAWGLKNCTA